MSRGSPQSPDLNMSGLGRTDIVDMHFYPQLRSFINYLKTMSLYCLARDIGSAYWQWIKLAINFSPGRMT